MEINNKVAPITGAGSGIGNAVAIALANRGAKAVIMVDMAEQVRVNAAVGREVAYAYQGDVTEVGFRQSVYDDAETRFGVASICIPAAGITRDSLSVRLDRETTRLILDYRLPCIPVWAIACK